MKTSVMGDPTWANAIGNIGDLFNPRTEAEGAALRGRKAAFEAEARYNNARAAGTEDQNRAYDVATLVANGMNPLDARIFVATRDNNLSTVGRGLNQLAGGRLLQTGGDPRVGLALTDQAATAGRPDFAWTDTRANAITAAENAAKLNQVQTVQQLKNAADLEAARINAANNLAIAQARPVEVSAGASALFAPGDPRNPNGVPQPLTYTPGKGQPLYRPGAATTPSQVFTAPALPGRSGTNADGTPRTGNPTLDEAELLKKIQLEEAGGKALAAQAAYPLQGGAPLSDAVTNAARQAFPTDTPSVAISKWMAANGVTVDNDWNALSSNKSTLMKGDKPLTLADLLAPNAPASPAPAAAPAAGGQPAAPASASGVAPSGVTPTKTGGFIIDGIPFEKGSTLQRELKHGQMKAGFNTLTNKMEVLYWDAENDGWSDTPIGGDPEAAADSAGNFDTYYQRGLPSVFPQSAKADAEKAILAQAVQMGLVDQNAVAAAQASGTVGDLISGLEGQMKQVYATQALRDPRIASYAKGDFLGDKGLPDDAMELADRMGIDRKAYGIPEGLNAAGGGDLGNLYNSFLQNTPGSLFFPGYGGTQDAMIAGLKRYFQDVQSGKVATR